MSAGHLALSLAPTQLPNTSITIKPLSNLTSSADITGVGVLMPKPKPPPKAPAEFDVPGTSLSLEFSDYAQGVQAGEVLLVFLQSLLKAFDTILAAGRDVPLTEDERFEEISVYMIVYGGRRMTYSIMRAAIGAIVGFMIEYGTFGIHVKITRDDQTISNILIGRK